MKITAIQNNRNENGTRADLFGSNPHSEIGSVNIWRASRYGEGGE